MIAVVTDSTSDLPIDKAKSLGIDILPLSVTLNNRTLLDWSEIDPDAIYTHQRNGGKVTSAPCTVSAFVELYTKLLTQHEQILSIHISEKLSETIRHARSAAREIGAEDRIVIQDSGLASVSLAETVLRVRHTLQAGGNLEAALRDISFIRDHIYAEFTVPSLKYLRQSQRISRAQELVGNMLSLRPVLTFQEGELRPVRRVRVDQALEDIIHSLEEQFRGTEVSIGVAYGGRDPVRLNNIRHAIGRSSLKVKSGRFQMIGPVIGSHVGPGMYGVSAAPA